MSKVRIKYLGIIATMCIKNAYNLVDKTSSFKTLFTLLTDIKDLNEGRVKLCSLIENSALQIYQILYIYNKGGCGSVVRTWHFHSWGWGLIPGRGTNILQAM